MRDTSESKASIRTRKVEWWQMMTVQNGALGGTMVVQNGTLRWSVVVKSGEWKQRGGKGGFCGRGGDCS